MKKNIIKLARNLLLFTLIIASVGAADFFLILYLPFTNLRDLWVTTAMTTMTHRWLATDFLSQKQITDIMNKNKVIQQESKVNLNDINVSKADLKVQEEPITGKTYKGYMLIINDPSRVYLNIADDYGIKGQKLYDMAISQNAAAGINAGGFDDDNGQGTGGGTDGIIVSHGRIVQTPKDNKFGFVGFTKDNKLVVGDYTLDEIKSMNIRDGASFYPSLIVNGVPNTIVGNGGGGLQPRTAIGQRKDGTVLMLVIDGRQVQSAGAYYKDVQQIMEEYGAYNASNLDGGSSATMFYNGKVINSPCSKDGARYLPDAFLVK